MKTKVQNLLVTLALFASVHPAVAQGTWTNLAPMPTAVAYSCGVVCDGKFYVLDGSALSPVWSATPPQVYDPIANGWSVKTVDPVSRADAVAGVIGSKIYVAEGWVQSDDGLATSALEIYDPATDTWTAGASSLVPRGSSAAAVVGGKFYITGGRGRYYNGNITTLEVYDPVSNTWTNGAPIPAPQEGALGASLNGKFYVVGGFVRPANVAITTVFIYDPAADTWSYGAPLPTPREFAGGGVINGKLYVTGGNAGDGATNNPVMVYDPALDSWSLAAVEPTLRSSGAAAAVNGSLLFAGGLTNNTANSTTTTEAFTPSPASPALTIASVANQIVLFWPATGTNYILQSVTNLTSTNWITASDAVPVIAFTVTNTSPVRFFRLQSQ